MAHKSLIECDKCGEKAFAIGGPYPEDWGAVSITTWKSSGVGQRIRNALERDLCPKCLRALKEKV